MKQKHPNEYIQAYSSKQVKEQKKLLNPTRVHLVSSPYSRITNRWRLIGCYGLLHFAHYTFPYWINVLYLLQIINALGEIVL